MDYDILRCGAVADGVTNCAAAIQQAVDAAAAAGGGRVVVPAGRFLSGSVLLRDNVELHLKSGAVLISSLNPDDIVPFPQGGDGTDPDDTADGWEGGFFLGASHAKNVTWCRRHDPNRPRSVRRNPRHGLDRTVPHCRLRGCRVRQRNRA